jgi:ribosomal protein S18 acetylase RimI-like enzyme
VATVVPDAVIHRSGPFSAILSDGTPWANFAVPVELDAAPAAVDNALAALTSLFARRGRTLRVIVKDALAPALPPLLERAGLRAIERLPLMLCTPRSYRPLVNAEVHVRFLRQDDADLDLAAYQTIRSTAFDGGGWRPTPEALAAFRQELASGGERCAALATLDGRPVGTGFVSVRGAGCEILRIATVPEARCRGVAATTTSFVTGDGFARGCAVAWLTAEIPAAQALYQKLGFREAGDEITYQPPAAISTPA